jgi:hypothetical protein
MDQSMKIQLILEKKSYLMVASRGYSCSGISCNWHHIVEPIHRITALHTEQSAFLEKSTVQFDLQIKTISKRVINFKPWLL